MPAERTFERGSKQPSDDEIIAALSMHFDAPPSAAIAWLSSLVIWFDAKAATDRLAEREGRTT